MAKSGGGAGFIRRRKRSGAGHVGRLARLVLQKKSGNLEFGLNIQI
jgi:hypothetical protein